MPVESRLTVCLIDVDDGNEITIERLGPNDEEYTGPLFAFTQTTGSVNLSLNDLADLIEALRELIQRNGKIEEPG